MEFDYQLAKEIILISIPVIGGGITAMLTADRWQKQKEMNSIKREIITEYETSLKRRATFTTRLVHKIIHHYTNWELVDGTNINIDKDLIFPKDPSQLPLEKFSDDYKKFEEFLKETAFTGSRFLSSLRFYYKDPKLIEACRSVDVNVVELTFGLRKILHCKDELKFKKLIKEYAVLDKSNVEVISKFENLLVKTPIKINHK